MTPQQQNVIERFLCHPVEPLPDEVKQVLSQPGARDYVIRRHRELLAMAAGMIEPANLPTRDRPEAPQNPAWSSENRFP